MLHIKIGDRVSGKRICYDEEITVEGVVTNVSCFTAGDKPMENITVKTDDGYEDWFGNDEDTVIISRYVAPRPAWMIALANRYGVTPDRIYEENMNFLQSEGYFETSRDVIECHTFDHWMKLACRKPEFKTTEPYMKGDLGYGL